MSRLEARFERQFDIDEVPSGTINGSNVTFTLSQTPKENSTTEGSVDLYLNGLKQTPGVHYTISGVTITMTTAPALAQELTANYKRRTGGV